MVKLQPLSLGEAEASASVLTVMLIYKLFMRDAFARFSSRDFLDVSLIISSVSAIWRLPRDGIWLNDLRWFSQKSK